MFNCQPSSQEQEIDGDTLRQQSNRCAIVCKCVQFYEGFLVHPNGDEYNAITKKVDDKYTCLKDIRCEKYWVRFVKYSCNFCTYNLNDVFLHRLPSTSNSPRDTGTTDGQDYLPRAIHPEIQEQQTGKTTFHEQFTQRYRNNRRARLPSTSNSPSDTGTTDGQANESRGQRWSYCSSNHFQLSKRLAYGILQSI